MSEHDERGVALVIVMMTMTLLTALGSALTLATIIETAIAANYRDAAETLYAAEGAIEFAVQEVAEVGDWREVLAESGQSAFVDGPAGGIRTVGAVTLDLTQATREINATSAEGGTDTSWVLYAFGRFEDLVPSHVSPSRIYVAVWIADRSETAGDETAIPEALAVVAQAYGTRGSRRAVELLLTRTDTSTVRARSWREWR